jgi:hypothetical protein
MAQISGAGTPVDIKLGQRPTITEPSLNYELQGIYNALHILSQYLETLRAGLEGSDSQTPAENIRFLKFINGPAKQVITAGQIVTIDYADGTVIKGTSAGDLVIKQFNNNGINRAYVSGMIQTFFGIAQNDAQVGENVSIGIGPGILKVTGAISGQQIWAATARGQAYSVSNDHPSQLVLYDNPLSGDGNVYLANPSALRLPGYPQDVSGTLRILGHYLFSPIGIAVANDYVLFSDFLFWQGRVATSVFELYP